jgi:tyrosine-protein kinase
MPSKHEDGRGRTLADYFEIIQRYKVLIIVTALMVPMVAFVASSQQEKIYGSSAEVLLSTQDLGSVLTGIPTNSDITEPDRHARTQAALARVPAVAQLALQRAKVTSLTPYELLERSSVSPRESTDLLNFEVRDPNPQRALTLATAYARAFTTYKVQMDTGSLSRARQELQQRLTELRRTGGADSDAYRELLQKAQDLRTLELLQAPATVVRPAIEATQVEPRPLRNAALGLFLGLLIGIGAALALSTLDRRIRDADEVERELGVPLLARLPQPQRRADSLTILDRGSDDVAEAVSRLRTNFDFANSHVEAKMVLVTSAVPGEGKSTTVSNLAIALARTGRHVVLVDLDLRRPTLARIFRLPDGVGVTDAATGNVELEAVINRVAHTVTRSWVTTGRSAESASGLLEVITVGRTTVDAAAFVETAGLASTLQRLRARADVVFLDASPILATGDAMALTGKVDAILVVNRLGKLTRPALDDLRRALDRSPAPTIGFVATGAPVEESYMAYRAESRPTADVATIRQAGRRKSAGDEETTVREAAGGRSRWSRPSGGD